MVPMNLPFEKTVKLLGDRIRILRKAQGLTQQDLGEKTGLNYKFIGEIERGNQNPSIKVLIKIADVLDIEFMELFRIREELSDRDEILKAIAKTIEKMPDESLKTVLQLLRLAF